MVRLRAMAEAFRGSLFFLPSVFVLLAIALAQLLLRVDGSVGPGQLPPLFRSTVESARAVLGTIAGATVTVAGVVFSVTMVSVQLASSQFSPRILRGFFRDRFQQAVIGFVVATFTYCLLVLRAVRSPTEAGGAAIVPNLSVVVAVVLGVGAALAILMFIDHTARSMQVGNLVRRTALEALERIRELPETGEARESPPVDPEPPAECYQVRCRDTGWVQQLDRGKLLRAVPPGTEVRVETRVGRFVSEGAIVFRVHPVPERAEEVASELHDAIHVGPGRTMQQDVSFGFRQLVDIALRALSPGINDPTTAYEVLVHLGLLVRELLLRDLDPPVTEGEEGRRLVLTEELSYEEYVGRAFDQFRVAAAGHPMLVREILRTLGGVAREVERAGLGDRAGAIRRQAALLVAGAEAAGLLPHDLERVREEYRRAGFGES